MSLKTQTGVGIWLKPTIFRYEVTNQKSSGTAQSAQPLTIAVEFIEMLNRFLKFMISALAACALTNLASAEQIPSISTTMTDPFYSCRLLTENLPHDIEKIREIAELQNEKIASCAEYAGEPPEKCTAHLLTFPGLELTVLGFENEAAPVAATISNSDWKLLGEIRVGQQIEVLEKYYGVKIPKKTSPVELMGECTPLIAWHSGGRVTKVSLPCHACN